MGRNEIGVHGAFVALTGGRRTHFCRTVVFQRTASALCPCRLR
ncbi:hypothetical protein J2S58_001389 [Nakamurella flavida]|nr:hypothetical protein [Nakamurella flavida]MDP9777766.1 hypothetical protein [Nakamurella flavida]